MPAGVAQRFLHYPQNGCSLLPTHLVLRKASKVQSHHDTGLALILASKTFDRLSQALTIGEQGRAFDDQVSHDGHALFETRLEAGKLDFQRRGLIAPGELPTEFEAQAYSTEGL